ncbi:hypothetical protein GALMADRAFT_139913 [Galerina marginata CBS 339.88]|uniref:Transmembrane protein n=1 Tax=Galerina marginata (strain CBS 339.88) TaxID=685588 RepID=A0A067SZ06_GALM3|nr:hypothetical protein GALMADRAFT_139913 [Galerina marginata CBS 339.88]
MSNPPRRIIVDDTDPNINYSGPWFQDRGSLDDIEHGGPPWNSTVHGVNANASLSYNFTGSEISLYGTVNHREVDTNGGANFSLECSIDGVTIRHKAPSVLENNQVVCEAHSLSEGSHLIEITATISNSSNTFWFDHLHYLPFADVPLDDATIWVGPSDPAIQYGIGWASLDDVDTVVMSPQTGAKAAFDFVGVQLAWYSMIPANNSTATTPTSYYYSIDGAVPAIPFALPSPSDVAQPNQLIFQTGKLSPGKHHIEVTHDGGKQATPLFLQYLVIQNATLADSSPNNGTGVSSHASSPVSRFPTGAVVGGIISGIMVVAGIIFLLLHQQRRRRESQRRSILPYGTPDLTPPFPGVKPFNIFPVPMVESKRPPTYGRPMPPFPIQTTGKIVRADRRAVGVASIPFPDEETTLLRSDPRSERVVRHEDSGVRMPGRDGGSVVELPPLYTPG